MADSDFTFKIKIIHEYFLKIDCNQFKQGRIPTYSSFGWASQETHTT